MKYFSLALVLAALCVGCEGTTPGADGTLSFHHADSESPTLFSFDDSVRRPLGLGGSALIVVNNDGAGTAVTKASSSNPKVLAVAIVGGQVVVTGMGVGAADLSVEDKSGAKGKLTIAVHEAKSIELLVDWLVGAANAPNPTVIAVRPQGALTVRRIARDENADVLMGAGLCKLTATDPSLVRIKGVADDTDNRTVEHAGVAGMTELSCGSAKLAIALDADDAVADLKLYDLNTAKPLVAAPIALGAKLTILVGAYDKEGRQYGDLSANLAASSDADLVSATVILPMVVTVTATKVGQTVLNLSMGGAVQHVPIEIVAKAP